MPTVQLEVVLVGHVGDPSGLRHPVPFPDGNPDALKILQDIVRDGSGAGKAELDPVESQPFLELPEDGKIGEMICEAKRRRRQSPGELLFVVAAADPQSDSIGGPLEPGRIGHLQDYAGIILLPDARHGVEEGGRYIPHVHHHRIRVFREIDDVPDRQMDHQVVDLLIDVIQRQK